MATQRQSAHSAVVVCKCSTPQTPTGPPALSSSSSYSSQFTRCYYFPFSVLQSLASGAAAAAASRAFSPFFGYKRADKWDYIMMHIKGRYIVGTCSCSQLQDFPLFHPVPPFPLCRFLPILFSPRCLASCSSKLSS